MVERQHLLLIYGGRSPEHAISRQSAAYIAALLANSEQFQLQLLYIDHSGAWHQLDMAAADPMSAPYQSAVHIRFGQSAGFYDDDGQRLPCHCVLPLVHGGEGENGSISGLLALCDLPCVVPEIAGLAVTGDKVLCKRILAQAGLPCGEWGYYTIAQLQQLSYESLLGRFSTPFFMKSPCYGSSIGVVRVNDAIAYQQAVNELGRLGDGVLLESLQTGLEVEVSLLGGADDPHASLPGSLVTGHGYYTYEAKYQDPDSLTLQTPAPLPMTQIKQLQQYSKQAYSLLQLSGMARIDWFVDGDTLVLNEINSIPGMTALSLFLKNWQASGLDAVEVINQMVNWAQLRHSQKQAQRVAANQLVDSMSSLVDVR